MEHKTLFDIMLFDFFGEVLTKKQQMYYDLYYNEDLSLSEIGERAGITKQGVYDIVKRAGATLAKIETKTGIVKKWMEARAEIEAAIAAGEMVYPAAIKYFHLDNTEN